MDLDTLDKQYTTCTEIKVKWGEMDAFQHLNNTIFIRYLEDGRIDLFEKIGMSSDMKDLGIGPILASVQCDYLAPVTYPDTLLVFTKAHQTGPKKIQLDHKIWSQQQNKLVAQGQGLGVYYDYKALRSCVIPPSIAAKFAAHAE
ncbi:MAG: thioesterase family protein [Gammaproteobacteria bacterium]|nr:thioesterase family protein [Gammaproteobacteria bacterium]